MDWGVVAVLVVLLLALVAGVRRAPRTEPRRRWRSRLAERLERAAGRLRHGPHQPDPFDVLRLQVRLGVLAEEVRVLEADRQVYAKAHRLRATKAAYDDLLEEACHLAGVPLERDRSPRDQQRLREEVELVSRGWSW